MDEGYFSDESNESEGSLYIHEDATAENVRTFDMLIGMLNDLKTDGNLEYNTAYINFIIYKLKECLSNINRR